MRTYQTPAPFAGPGDWWTPLEEIFDIGWFAEHRMDVTDRMGRTA